jgi:hypothetical protein
MNPNWLKVKNNTPTQACIGFQENAGNDPTESNTYQTYHSCVIRNCLHCPKSTNASEIGIRRSISSIPPSSQQTGQIGSATNDNCYRCPDRRISHCGTDARYGYDRAEHANQLVLHHCRLRCLGSILLFKARARGNRVAALRTGFRVRRQAAAAFGTWMKRYLFFVPHVQEY